MLDLSKIKAISFDLDDTLWPVWPTIAKAEQALLAWLEVNAPEAARLSLDRELLLRIRHEVHADHPDRAHALGWLREEAIRRLLGLAGHDAALAPMAYEVFWTARQAVDFYEDSLPALAHLSARWPLVALSNGNADIHRVGIGHCFAARIWAQEAGVSKPDVRIFQQAADALALPMAAILHVGDDAHHDVIGALDAGMQAVWVNRSGGDWPVPERRPHVEVRDLAELCRLWP